jgi:LysM repeat protein
MRSYFSFMCTLLLAGCTSSFTAFRGHQDSTMDDLRMEVADLKHALHATEVEVKILEERVEAAEGKATTVKIDETADLKKKISALERSIDKINGEIRSLASYTSQTTASLSQYREQILMLDRKLDEVAKLRSTLSELSQSARQYESSATYRVKTGDSLEKIARKYQVSVEALKQENKLSSDKIIVGQELSIPLKD